MSKICTNMNVDADNSSSIDLTTLKKRSIKKTSKKFFNSIRKDDTNKPSSGSRSCKRALYPEVSLDMPPSKKKKSPDGSNQSTVLATETHVTAAPEQLEANDLNQISLSDGKVIDKLVATTQDDLVNIVIDEISLEGLDGITIDALWTRLSDAVLNLLKFREHMKISVWNITRSVDRIYFYELPEPRPALEIFNRYKYFDWETGHVIEPDEYPMDIYPFAPISEKVANAPTIMTNSVLGSCATFETRKDVTEDVRMLSLDEAEKKFGSKLVMVADQSLRTKTLISEFADPAMKLSNVQYCILERIGRSRRLGEVTAGQNSLMNFGDSKTLFYLRKQLVKNNFITKQTFCIRSKSSGNSIGLLFHLRKFYSEHKSKKQMLIEQVVDILKKKPNHRMEYVELKKIVGQEAWSKGGLQKLLKTPDFKQFIHTDMTVTYRTMYPDALPKEWKLKNGPKEKSLRVLQLINPFVNVSAVCREEDQKDESSDDEPIGEYPFNTSIFNHTYNLIFKTGCDGLSLKQLQKKLGLEFYLARSILNNMVKRNMVDTANIDIGRQHIMKYYARCFNNQEFCAKFNDGKDVRRPIAPVQSCPNDEVLDFIAGVLKVDVQVLKTNSTNDLPAEQTEKEETVEDNFGIIKEFRRNNRLEKFNTAEKNRYKAENLSQLALRDDAEAADEATPTPNTTAAKYTAELVSPSKEHCDGIFKNFHLYYPMELSRKQKRIEHLPSQLVEPSTCFAAACSYAANRRIDKGNCATFVTQHEINKVRAIPLDLKLSRSRSTPFKHEEHRLLGSTKTIHFILQNYFFSDIECDYKTFLFVFENTIDKIKEKANKNDLLFPSELESDDEHYNSDEDRDDWSIMVRAGNSRNLADDNKSLGSTEVEDFKHALVTDFETAAFSDKRDPPERARLQYVSSRAFERPSASDQQPAKRIKVVDTEKLLERNVSSLIDRDKKITQLCNPQRNLIRMNLFMGTNPVICSQAIDEDGIETIVIISTTPERYAEVGTRYKNKQMSERSLARANFIIDTVHREKMILDLSKLTAILKTVEKRSNCSGTIDKKTLDRLVHKLVAQGYVKMVKIVLKYDSIIRVKDMICLPPVHVNTVVQSTIDQMKMSFFIYAKRKTFENLKEVEDKVECEAEMKGQIKKSAACLQEDNDCNESLNEMDALLASTNETSKYRYSRIIGKQYGYVPKFTKFKILHEIIFYLVYAYDGEEVGKDDVPNLLKQLNVKLDDLNVSELSCVYKREISWKMFVPPLPKHKNWSKGWALVCDILLRLPLSIFVKIYNISYIIPELMPFLNHPLKRHFLLKHVPSNIRNGFLSNRKYIFSIHEILCNLCYLGLVQFGAQKLRDKDQQFIYLNSNAVLYDTVPSESGYHQISQMDYKKMTFSFRSEADVEEYWSKMWSISMSTKLGLRYSQLQKTITLQNIHGKTSMMEAMLPKTPERALEADVGYIPGDHLGACCLDSSTWVHVKRNWVWASHSRKTRKSELPAGAFVTGLRKKHLEQVKIKPITYRQAQREITKRKLAKREGDASQGENKKLLIKKKSASKRKLPVYRKVLPRPPTSKKTNRTVDDVDTKIINKMGKSRSIWSEEEDITLVLCKTSTTFLCPNVKMRMVPHTAVRDVMHRLCPHKRKKPSTAYSRRYLKIIKSEDLEGKQKFLYGLDNDKMIQKYFAKFRDKLKTDSCITDEQLCVAFVYLASYAMDHYKLNFRNQQKKLQDAGCIDYLTLDEMHKFDCSLTVKDADILYRDPRNEDDIKIDLIKSIIHCSLGWKPDSSDVPLTLYRIYQNFPDYLLRSAITCLREQQIISGKKAPAKHVNVKEVISVGGSQIHSSFAYSFKQITKYPDYIFPEAHEFVTGIRKYTNSTEFLIKNFEQGHGLGLSEIASKYKATFIFKVPDEFLVLDPNITDHSELFQELAVRYKLMLSKRHVSQNFDETDQESNEQLQKMIERIFETYSRHASTRTDHVTENRESVANTEESRDAVYLRGQVSTNNSADSDESRLLAGAVQTVEEFHKMLNISDLAYLLTKGLFPERDDEERLEKLHRHFLLMFPCSSFKFSPPEEGGDWYREMLSAYSTKSTELVKMIERHCIVNNGLHGERDIFKDLKELGANVKDLETGKCIVAFVHTKSKVGVTSRELKDQFPNNDGNLDLCTIMSVLMNKNLIIRAGISSFRFIHFECVEMWTTRLDEQSNMSESDRSILGLRMKPMPWLQINGTVNARILLNWLGIILSHCMSFPFLTFEAVAKRFNFLKPLDVFYLLDYLQELSCIRLYTYEQPDTVTLFSNFSYTQKRRVNILDDFDDMFVETDNMATIKLGAYWSSGRDDVKTPFDV